MTNVDVRLPGALAELAGGQRVVTVVLPEEVTVAGVLDELSRRHPRVGRRIRDERGALRRYVNLYVRDVDVRQLSGLATPVRDGDSVHVLPSVAGG